MHLFLHVFAYLLDAGKFTDARTVLHLHRPPEGASGDSEQAKAEQAVQSKAALGIGSSMV